MHMFAYWYASRGAFAAHWLGRRGLGGVALGAWLSLFLFASAGCDAGHMWFFTCKEPDLNHVGPNGELDPCYLQGQKLETSPPCWGDEPHEEGALCPGARDLPQAAGCAGKCIAPLPDGWYQLAMVSFGDKNKAPTCPVGLYSGENDRYFDLVVPQTCSCDCEPSTGSCALPSKLTASTAPCYQPGGSSFPFDAPASWKGACSAENPLPASKGVQSITIAPLTMTEGDCQRAVPSADPTPTQPEYRGIARICGVDLFAPGCGGDHPICVPLRALPDTLQLCIHTPGQVECPVNWPERYIASEDLSVAEHRTCSTCACSGKPEGSQCLASVSIYQDAVCGTPPFFSNTIKEDRALCIDVASDVALLSKSAEAPLYVHGTCDHGEGPALGEAEIANMETYCCQPKRMPPG